MIESEIKITKKEKACKDRTYLVANQRSRMLGQQHFFDCPDLGSKIVGACVWVSILVAVDVRNHRVNFIFIGEHHPSNNLLKGIRRVDLHACIEAFPFHDRSHRV